MAKRIDLKAGDFVGEFQLLRKGLMASKQYWYYKCTCGSERIGFIQELKRRKTKCTCDGFNLAINKYVYPEPNTGCWLWAGSQDKDGYGKFGRNTERVHRIMYERTNCEKLSSDVCVCHTCDQPSCVNPTHLFKGSNIDNQKDKVNKNRQAKGSKHGRAKVNEQDVIDIRNLKNNNPELKIIDIAKTYNVNEGVVSNIVNRKSWKHI